MTQPFPLEILKVLSLLRNDQATRQLGHVNRRFQDEEKKLALLQNFRADYEARYQKAGQQGESCDTLTNFRHFLDRLDEAVRQQLGVLDQMRQQVFRQQGSVRQTHRQVKSMEVLADRHRDRELERVGRLEQKTTDEQVGQKIARHVLGID